MRIVLGLEARDVEEVVALLDPQPAKHPALPERSRVDAIGHDRRGRAVAREVVRADHLGVGHQPVRQHAGQALGEREDRPPEGTPFGAALLDPVHVQERGRAGGREQRQEEGVRGVHDERGVEALAGGMEAGEQRVHGGVEVLGADRRQVDQTRAAKVRAARRRPAAGRGRRGGRRAGGRGAAVDGDVEVARHEARRELREERLVAAVAPGDAARADERDPEAPEPRHSGSPERRNQRPMARAGTLLRRWTRRRWATSSRRWRQSQA